MDETTAGTTQPTPWSLCPRCQQRGHMVATPSQLTADDIALLALPDCPALTAEEVAARNPPRVVTAVWALRCGNCGQTGRRFSYAPLTP